MLRIFMYLFFKFPMIRNVENWYGQNRTGRTATSGLDTGHRKDNGKVTYVASS